MSKLATDIQELVLSQGTISREEYLKRAIGLQYRFIRIHPFPDSNGRTSRALLNMMTIPVGILVNFPKDRKAEFTKVSNDTHKFLDAKGYLKAIEGNADNLVSLETEAQLPLYEFIKENCLVDMEHNTHGESKPISREVDDMSK